MFKILDEACTPTRGTKYSAAVDLRAREDITIAAGETKLVPLGIKIDTEALKQAAKLYVMENTPYTYDVAKYDDVAEAYMKNHIDFFLSSHYLQLMLRSGLGKKGLILPNGVGVIDLDYQDEIMMIVHNPIIHIDKTIDFNCDEDYIELDYMGVSDKDECICSSKFTIKKGDRVGQITLLEQKSYLFGIDTKDERTGGFGSTGKC